METLSDMDTTTDASLIPQCDLFNDTTKCDVVIITKRVFASISVLGSVLMIINMLVYKKYKNFIQRIILYMTVAAFISAIAYVMGDLQNPGPVCTFQGFVTNFSDWCVLMWMFMITLTLYLTVVKETQLDRIEWVFHIICWGVPFIISCIIFADGNRYGPAGAWCWIEMGATYWRFGTWYIPLVIFIIIMIILYLHMIFVVKRRTRNSESVYGDDSQRRVLDELKPLRAYPFIYLLLNIFPLINRIQNAASKDPLHPEFALTLLHVISISLLGAVNALIFGMNRQTLREFQWSNFRLQVKAMCSRSDSIVGEYEVQNNDGANEND